MKNYKPSMAVGRENESSPRTSPLINYPLPSGTALNTKTALNELSRVGGCEEEISNFRESGWEENRRNGINNM